MGRRKTTMYVDEDVLTATKVLAAGRGDSESQVVEDALRAYLDADRLEVARGVAGPDGPAPARRTR